METEVEDAGAGIPAAGKLLSKRGCLRDLNWSARHLALEIDDDLVNGRKHAIGLLIKWPESE